MNNQNNQNQRNPQNQNLTNAQNNNKMANMEAGSELTQSTGEISRILATQKLVGLELKDEDGAPGNQILFCWQDDAVVSIPYADNKVDVDAIQIYVKAGDWTLKEIYENIIKTNFGAELSEWQPIYR